MGGVGCVWGGHTHTHAASFQSQALSSHIVLINVSNVISKVERKLFCKDTNIFLESLPEHFTGHVVKTSNKSHISRRFSLSCGCE